MNKFVCVLKTGGDYTKEHVYLLKKQVDKYLPIVDKFICYSNEEIEGIDTVPLIGGYKGRWVMQEVFREKGKVMVTGLDTLFIKNCGWLYDLADNMDNNDFYGIRVFKHKNKFANGVMLWNGDWSHLFWDYVNEQTPYHIKLEMNWTYEKLKKCKANINFLDDIGFNGVSYKHHCRGKGLPKDAEVVLFHGKPRPHECKEKWVQERYYG